MKKHISRYIKYSIPILFIIIAIITYNIRNKKHETIVINKHEKYISVYVKGNIKEEKIVRVKKNTTIKEVIDLCGGIKDNSDLSNINLKDKVKQGDIIEIPIKDKNKEEIQNENNINNNKININSADKKTLMSLTGIGEKTAEKIIRYREENKFSSIEDIKTVSGIGEKKYEKIKNEITI